jgi:hypothetical protein
MLTSDTYSAGQHRCPDRNQAACLVSQKILSIFPH